MAAATGYWHFHNRRWLGPTFKVDVEFVSVPPAAVTGQAARFVAHVEADNKNTPLAGPGGGGNISMMIEAADAGKFTLVATDSASEKEGTVNFFAVPKG